MRVLLATPHGFCAGVVRAIEILDSALELYGRPLYVYHEIVHNKHIVQQFVDKGVVFVGSLDEVPTGGWLLFSAHGVSPQVRQEAAGRLRTIDATCPLVAKVHAAAARMARNGYQILLIGHAGHDEVVGTMGVAPGRIRLVESVEQAERIDVPDPQRVAFLTQTTLSLDDANRIITVLRRRFPKISGPRSTDICYATQNRQDAVRQLAAEADVVLVLGSRNSSNSLRLVEVSRECGVEAYLIDDVGEIEPLWLVDAETVVLTAGASAPEHVVADCMDWLRKTFGATMEERRIREENVAFPLPVLPIVDAQAVP